jgi:arrestin-related trafficking adapter 3/6
MMSCWARSRRVPEPISQDDLLIFTRPGLLSVDTTCGILRRPFSHPTHSAQVYPRPISRQTFLIQPSHRPLRPRRPPHILEILVQSRESAKRLLRFTPFHHPSQQINLPAPYPRQLELDTGTGDADTMVSADGERHSPVRRDRAGPSVSASVGGSPQRPPLLEEGRSTPVQANLLSERPVPTSSILCDEKPIASGNGLSISVSLAEPVMYLQGYDQNDSTSHTTSMLRGGLHLHVTKPVKLKSISLTFRGKSETEWPEGIPPRRTEYRDSEIIMNHTWPFFNAQFPQAEHGYSADVVHLFKGPSVSTQEVGVTASSFDLSNAPLSQRSTLNSREAKRLSLQMTRSRSFGKGESLNAGPTVAQKGFKVFHPGDYVYNFELPVDSRMPESINVELGNVRYELEALVERSGAFRANLVGVKELTMIRTPSEGSLEQIEPIAISRNWEDQLHYDIVISGKSFPLGATVPIAFKLTPLAKVQCHRIKVFVTENIQYFTINKRVHRLEPTRKVQLFEKRADAPSTSAYPGSAVRITAGGGIPWDHRQAAAIGDENVPRDQINLLGNLEDDAAGIGPTEMEFDVKLPTCPQMKERGRSERLHFDTTYQNIQVNHWIKVRRL